MGIAATEEKRLKALAVAIVDRPRGTLTEIARATGISKATLNRICGTRENLIEMLLNLGTLVINRAIASANLETLPPMDALKILVEHHLAEYEMLVFMVVLWRPESKDGEEVGQRLMPYSKALDAFFLRGQEQGIFRIDVDAPALTELFTSILFGLIEAERRGRIPRAGLSTLVETVFLRGANRK